MSTLHLLFSPPTAGTALADCLRAASDGDTVLLLQDGVYAAVARATAPAALLREAVGSGVTVAALAPDVAARGIGAGLHAGIELVDDDGFVELTEQYPRTLSWL